MIRDMRIESSLWFWVLTRHRDVRPTWSAAAGRAVKRGASPLAGAADLH
jgi:hypothetical protein